MAAANDPYSIIGVKRDATQDEVRTAYRKLAKAHHPDLNPGKKESEARFKEITAAYDLLSDPEKRARFDRGEIDASGAERPDHAYYRRYAEGAGGAKYHGEGGANYQSEGGADDLGDIFADLFGGQGRGRAGGQGGIRLRGLFPGRRT
ncbi:MAG: J domain-containing protein, partial [Alphaproteobacteria bacterium]|nr:J domain-containing protein [Alphaproteobacteria bacterium]